MLLFCLGALALAGCGAGVPPEPRISAGDAYIVLPTVPGRPATLYFAIDAIAPEVATGGPSRLEAVAVQGATRAEMHQSMTMNGMSAMRPLAFVPVPNGVTRFCPGGHHVMLFGLDPRLVPGARTRVRLGFDKGFHLTPDAAVISARQAVADAPTGCEAKA